jgi:Ca-activated chloride channel homolog
MFRLTCLVIAALALACIRPLGAEDATFRDEVQLVEVYATVFDRGRAVTGLAREQFEVRDHGKPQPIRIFEASDKAFTCVLLLDTTASMRRSLPELRNAAREFIGALRPEDSVGVYAFTSELDELQAPTTDHALARRALMRLRAGGKTALFDSVSDVAMQMAKWPGKKAIVLLTDGGDNASVLNRRTAAAAARKRGIPVFAVAEGDAVNDSAASGLLRELSEATGGRLYNARSPKDMEGVLQAIAKDLQFGYLLAFRAPEEEHAAAWHDLQVLVKNTAKPVQVRARTGYSQ